MANFPAITPTYDLSKNSAPKVRVAQFGSGYSQRTVYGINQNPKSYLFTWNVSEADADTIEAFLDAREGKKALRSHLPVNQLQLNLSVKNGGKISLT